MAKDGGKTDGRSAKTPKPRKGLRKHLRRLERQVASAVRLEAKRVQKLEKARYRRQRLEALRDEVKLTAEIAAPETASAPTAAKAPASGAVAATSRSAPAARSASPAAKPQAHRKPSPPTP